MGDGVAFQSESTAQSYLAALGRCRVLADPDSGNAWTQLCIEEGGATLVAGTDPALLPKACKNAVEVQGARDAHVRDAVAEVRFLAWLDREEMLYAANGLIRRRSINSWTSRNVPFRAEIFAAEAPQRAAVHARELPRLETPEGRLVVRSARLFDGIGGGYRENLDIVIERGRIIAVEERADRAGAIVVDMGDLTALPGFIDTHVRLPRDVDPSLGPLLLAFGLTTLVADTNQADALNAQWSGKAIPGPLVLGDDWLLDGAGSGSRARGRSKIRGAWRPLPRI